MATAVGLLAMNALRPPRLARGGGGPLRLVVVIVDLALLRVLGAGRDIANLLGILPVPARLAGAVRRLVQVEPRRPD